MTVIKRDKKETTADLVVAVTKLLPLLKNQNEDAAVQDLEDAAGQLKKSEVGSKEFKAAIEKVIDAFDGDHELIAYTHQRSGSEWSEAEELSLASSRVLHLARRMNK